MPQMMLLIDATFVSNGVGAAIKRRPGYYAAPASTFVILVVPDCRRPRWRSAGFATGVSPWTYLLNQADMPAICGWSVWQTGLVVDYGRPVTLSIGAIVRRRCSSSCCRGDASPGGSSPFGTCLLRHGFTSRSDEFHRADCDGSGTSSDDNAPLVAASRSWRSAWRSC